MGPRCVADEMRCFTLVRRLPGLDDVTEPESALSVEARLDVDEPKDSNDDSRLPDRFLSSVIAYTGKREAGSETRQWRKGPKG